MKHNILSFVLLLTVTIAVGQKSQRIGYIDMEYILQNVPEYIKAQNALNDKVAKWRANLDKEARHIEVLKTDLANEKAILTKELIDEREEDITVKQESLRRLESLYFGPEGDMYNLRQKLIRPIQDQVYNSVQTIASRKKYDFVFDKSNDLSILYSNKKHDISELVLKMIGIERKKQTKREKIEERKNLLDKKELTEADKLKIKRKEDLIKKRNADKEAKKTQIEERRQALLKARDEKRKLLEEKREALKKAREEALKKKQTKEN